MTPEPGEHVEDDPKAKAREFFDRRKLEELREAKAEIAALKSKQTEEQWGLDENTDPRIRALIANQRRLEEELETVLSRTETRPGDDELGEYINQVMDDHGDEMRKLYPNRVKRLEAVRLMAEGLRLQTEGPKSHESTGRAKDAFLARVHVTGGGPSAQRGSRSEEQEFAEYSRKMREAKTPDERDKILADWEAKHPA